MVLFEVDVHDTYDDLWDTGLARLITAHADATVVVDELTSPITGTLAHLAHGGHLVIDQRRDEDTGTVVLVPLDRVLSVQAAYRRVDIEAERRARVAADKTFLARVRELAVPLAEQVTRIGDGQIRGAQARDLAEQLQADGFDHDSEDIEVALALLVDRGQLPPRAVV